LPVSRLCLITNDKALSYISPSEKLREPASATSPKAMIRIIATRSARNLIVSAFGFFPYETESKKGATNKIIGGYSSSEIIKFDKYTNLLFDKKPAMENRKKVRAAVYGNIYQTLGRFPLLVIRSN
jgi:hypothetical protein